MRSISSTVWVGEGGTPGLGSTYPAAMSLKCFRKFGQELWYVTTAVPA
jgi:hypothetical protein